MYDVPLGKHESDMCDQWYENEVCKPIVEKRDGFVISSADMYYQPATTVKDKKPIEYSP